MTSMPLPFQFDRPGADLPEMPSESPIPQIPTLPTFADDIVQTVQGMVDEFAVHMEKVSKSGRPIDIINAAQATGALLDVAVAGLAWYGTQEAVSAVGITLDKMHLLMERTPK